MLDSPAPEDDRELILAMRLSTTGPILPPRASPMAVAFSSTGARAVVIAWNSGAILGNTPSRRPAPIRPREALRLAKAPGTVEPISWATVPEAEAAAAWKSAKLIFPSDASFLTSAAGTPICSASAA